MTTFPIGSRVRVSDQHSQYRNRLGTVVVVGGTHTDVQLDGQGGGRRVRFDNRQLQATTQPWPPT